MITPLGVIICISTEKTLGSFPRIRLTYLIPHVQCGCNTAHVYLSKLGDPARAVGCCLFSSWDTRSFRISYSVSVDHAVGLQVVTLRQVTSSAEGVGEINRRPSYLGLCDVQVLHYCEYTCHRFNYRLLGNQQ